MPSQRQIRARQESSDIMRFRSVSVDWIAAWPSFTSGNRDARAVGHGWTPHAARDNYYDGNYQSERTRNTMALEVGREI